MLFVDSKRLAPVINEKDLPHEYDLYHFGWDEIPRSRKERTEFIKDNGIIIDYDWWRKQADRCRNGYEVENAIIKGGDCIRDGIECIWTHDDCYLEDYDYTIKNKKLWISGRLYFYLNFWKIYGLKKGDEFKTVISPYFVDMDWLFSMRLQNMFRYDKDGQELKARQLGFSEKIAGMFLAYNYTFHRASVNLIVAGLQEDADHTMENCVRGLDMLANTQFYLDRKRGGDSQSKVISVTDSQIRSQTAKDKPETLSRYSPTAVVYEEIGKGKKKWSLDVAGYVKPSIYTQGKKTGWQIFIGTGGDMENGVYDLEERHFNPEEYNILQFKRRHARNPDEINSMVSHVTPKWMFRIIDKDGNSMRRESIYEIEKEGELLTGEKKYNFMTQHAIYDDDIFMTNMAGFFGKDVVLDLNRRKIELKNNRELQITRKGRLVFKDPANPFKGLDFIEDNDDWWLEIVEEPETDVEGKPYANLYKAGTDSYDQPEAATSASEGACVVRKGFRQGQDSPHFNTFVALIMERPKVSEGGNELFYLHTAMVTLWYGTKNNIEHSKILIIQWYINNGFEILLKERPELAFIGQIKKSQLVNKYGTDGSLKAPGLAILKQDLTPEFIGRMYLLRIIEAWSKFKYLIGDKKYNCDITMATMEAAIMAKDEEMIAVFSVAERKRKDNKRGLRVFKRVNGRIVEAIV